MLNCVDIGSKNVYIFSLIMIKQSGILSIPVSYRLYAGNNFCYDHDVYICLDVDHFFIPVAFVVYPLYFLFRSMCEKLE